MQNTDSEINNGGAPTSKIIHVHSISRLLLRISYECLAIALFVLAIDVWTGRSIDFPVFAQWLALGMFIASICTSLISYFLLKGRLRKLAAVNFIAATTFGMIMVLLPRLSR